MPALQKAAPAAALATTAGLLGAYAVRGKSSNLLAPSFHRGVRTRPAIAFTFDDGPSESTPQLLEILLKYGAPASFFQCGANVRRLPHLSREVVAASHEIGNHTDSHPYLCFKSPAFIEQELVTAQSSIADATGTNPRFFRAPYGVRWLGLREVQRKLGLIGVMWTTIGVDWKWHPDRIVATLLRGAQNGAIFCLHDGRTIEARPDIRPTLEAVRRVVPILRDRGFHFERISQIICPTEKSPIR